MADGLPKVDRAELRKRLLPEFDRVVEERIALVDGAPWIRNQFEFHGLVDAIGLDFYHLQENTQKARRGVFGEDSEDGKNWVAELMHTFKHDGYDTAFDSMTTLRKPFRSPTKRAAVNRLMQYVGERREMVRYPEFRAKSWQIGSGPTEAECKTTTHRVKNCGRPLGCRQCRSHDGPGSPARQPPVESTLDKSRSTKELRPP